MNSNDPNKLLFGKLLGEIYRIQRRSNIPCSADDAVIYGLLNGFEHVVEEELEQIGFVSKDHFDHVVEVLNTYWQDPERLITFTGYYDIESDLESRGIDRSKAISILRYLSAKGQFTEVIKKMDTSNSPTECRTFSIEEWDH